MTQLSIRQADARDAAIIVEFSCRLAQESEGLILNRATIAAGVRRGLSRSDLCRYYVAERDGRVIGQLMVTYELTDWRDGVVWWVQSVYVESSSRGQGVFRTLLKAVEGDGTRDFAFRGMRLYVDRENKKAIATYAASGFANSHYDLMEKLK